MDTNTLSALSDFDNPEGQLATLPALNEDLALAMDRHEVSTRAPSRRRTQQPHVWGFEPATCTRDGCDFAVRSRPQAPRGSGRGWLRAACVVGHGRRPLRKSRAREVSRNTTTSSVRLTASSSPSAAARTPPQISPKP